MDEVDEMIIKVVGVSQASIYNGFQHKNQTKFYQPQENKSKVKEVFGMMLDTEIKKLKFDKVV